jgi:hypothetical protein
MGKVTQKEFVAAVREAGVNDPYSPSVDYRHPGVFHIGERQITLEMRQIARFLVKLSDTMSLDQYDKLTKAVYLGAMQAERTESAMAENKAKDGPRP